MVLLFGPGRGDGKRPVSNNPASERVSVDEGRFASLEIPVISVPLRKMPVGRGSALGSATMAVLDAEQERIIPSELRGVYRAIAADNSLRDGGAISTQGMTRIFRALTRQQTSPEALIQTLNDARTFYDRSRMHLPGVNTKTWDSIGRQVASLALAQGFLNGDSLGPIMDACPPHLRNAAMRSAREALDESRQGTAFWAIVTQEYGVPTGALFA